MRMSPSYGVFITTCFLLSTSASFVLASETINPPVSTKILRKTKSSLPIRVKNSVVIMELKKRLKAKKYSDAYQYALSYRDDEEGKPDFDFYFGLAALENGYPQQAQFAFERLVAEYPENSRFQLEYARSLFLLNDNNDARREFKRVLATQPPANVVKNIQLFLAAIKARSEQLESTFSGLLSLGGGYDSNINNATDAQWIGIFQLPQSARQTASFYNDLGFTGRYQVPVNQHTQWAIRFGSRNKYNYNVSTYNLDTFSLDFIGLHQWQKVAMTLRYGYSHTLLDGSDYQRFQQVSSDFRAIIHSGISVNGSVSAGVQDSFYSNLLDAFQVTGNLGISYLTNFSTQQLEIIAGSENTRRPEASYNGKKFQGINYQFHLTNAYFGKSWSPYFMIGGFWSKYKAAHPFFGKNRKDHSWQILSGISYRMKKHWQVVTELSRVKNNSSLSIYHYQRTLFETRLEYAF